MTANEARRIADENRIDQINSEKIHSLIRFIDQKIERRAKEGEVCLLGFLHGIRTPISEEEALQIAQHYDKQGFKIDNWRDLRRAVISW